MSKKAVAASVGLFVILVATMTIVLVLFISGNGFSSKEARRYVLLFDSSIKGLNIGAPVTLRGVKIGEVANIKTKLYANYRRVLNSVVVDIYPGTIVQQNESEETELMDELLQRGLAAKLGLQSVLTGLLYVEVDFFDSPPMVQPVKTQYDQIPTVPNNLEEILKKLENIHLASIAERLNEVLDNLATLTGDGKLQNLVVNVNSAFVGIEKMSRDMSDSMEGIRQEFTAISSSIQLLSQQLNQELPATNRKLQVTLEQVQQSMKVMQDTLVVMGDTLASDSPLIYQLEQSSRDISRASRAIEGLAGMLEREPDSVLFGRKEVAR